MRELSVTLIAAAAFLLIGSMAWTAAAATPNGTAIPNAARHFSPVHQAACQGFGPYCPPGFIQACNRWRCWCRPCR